MKVGVRLQVWWVLGWLCVLAAPAVGEPYLAVREGMQCPACHTNVTGGGKRTDLVATHARDILRYPNFFGRFSNPPEFFDGNINKFVALGSDLRLSESAIFQDKGSPSKCPGGTAQAGTTRCVDNNKVFRGRLEENDIDLTEATLYGEVRLIPDYLTFYIDQRFQPTTDTREVVGILRGVIPWNGFVKAGRVFVPYGLQIEDNHAFIRGGTNGSANTGFNFNLQEAGGVFGVEPGPFKWTVAVTDPSSSGRDVRLTTTASTMLTELPVVRSVMFGTSFSRVGSRYGGDTLRFSLFGGSNIGRFTYLAETDFLRDASQTGKNIGRFIAYGEGNYLFFGWLNSKVAVDFADNDGTLGATDDNENRVRFGVEPFLNRFVQARLFYSIANGVESKPTHNQNVLYGELHLFF